MMTTPGSSIHEEYQSKNTTKYNIQLRAATYEQWNRESRRYGQGTLQKCTWCGG